MLRQRDNSIWKIALLDVAFLIISGIAVGVVLHEIGRFDAVYFWLSIALMALTVISSFAFQEMDDSDSPSVMASLLSGVLSLVFLIVLKNAPGFPFWLLCSIITAALIDTGLGLFFGFFMILQAANISDMSTVVYFLHVICLFYLCLRIRKLKSLKEIIYIDTITSCTILCIYIVGIILNWHNVSEENLFFIIITYIILITLGGFMKLSLKNKKNISQPAEGSVSVADPSQDLAQGIGYLNEMAEDLSKRETTAAEAPADLEAILNAEIDGLQVDTVEPITDYTAPAGLSPDRDMSVDYGQLITDYSWILQDLKAVNRHVYVQSMRVASLSEEGSKRINANQLLTKAIASFYQTDVTSADFPDKLCTSIVEVNHAIRISGEKDTADDTEVLTSKEAAYVYLTHQIASVFFYLKASKAANISVEKIVDKALSAAILKGYLNNSGLSVRECSEIRKYFVEKLSSLM